MGENIFERNARVNGGIRLDLLKDQVDNLAPGDGGAVDLSNYYTKIETDNLLDQKQNVGSYATLAQLSSGLSTKADLSHTHNISDISTLQTTLDSKQPAGDYATNTALTNGLASKLNLSAVDAKGDLLVASADNTITRLGVGSNGQVLVADSTQTTGVKWSTVTSSSTSLSAKRYANCKALTFTPQNISENVTKSVTLTQNRLYAMWMPLDVGTVITGFKIPLVSLAAGTGTILFAIYQQDNSLAGNTADLNSSLSSGSAPEWRTVNLSSPVTLTGNGFWIVLLSHVSSGPGLFISDPNGIPGWASNPAEQLTALRLEDVTGGLPSTLAPATMIAYQDLMVGVY